MNEELILNAMRMFKTPDNPEKWNAFLELVNQNVPIQNRWWRKLIENVYNSESREEKPDWDIRIYPNNNWEIKWFIRGERDDSLVIQFWGEALRVVFFGALDINEVNKFREDQPLDIIKIKNCFERIDENNCLQTIGRENRNFSFDSIYDGKFSIPQLSWYAGNRTDDFKEKLIKKIRKFQTPEITALFKEINEKCRKDTP